MFKTQNFCHIASNNRNQVKAGVFVYRTTDNLATVSASGYFNARIIDINLHDLIIHEKIDASDATKVERNVLCVTERTLENVGVTVIKSKWEEDIEGDIEDLDGKIAALKTYVEQHFVNIDGSSIMSGPLKFRAGSFEGAIAGGLGDGISVYKLKSDGSIDSEVASLTKTNGFVPGTTNAMNIGSSSLKWKDAYIARVITSVLNNGADISVPTTSGTIALTSDIKNGTLTITQGGQTKGTFSANQSSNTTIDIDAVNVDLSNLSNIGKNISNWSSNVTNCITEIPQDIKLELATGTLTLKAGSKVYNTDGTYTTIASDTNITNSWGSANSGMVFYGIGSSYNYYPFERIHSGTTNPTGLTGNSHINFNTSDNKIYYTTNAGSSWTQATNSRLPLACVTWAADNTISSIDQVFNGFGYIGSTVFALPGVRVLAPYGRNADGTLKNNPWKSSVVLTRTDTTNGNRIVAINTITGIFGLGNYIYNEVENVNYDNGAISDRRCIVGKLTVSSGKITSFTFKTAFHAVDYSDFIAADSQNVKLSGNQTIADTKTFSASPVVPTVATTDNSQKAASTAFIKNLLANHYITEFQAPTQNNDYTWYRKYADGWVEQGGTYKPTSLINKDTVNIPIEMADTNYNIQVTIIDDTSSSAPTYASVGARTKGTTSFTTYGDSHFQKDWLISGKAA